MSVEPILKNVGILKRTRIRYWTLKFLSLHKGEVFDALVLDEMKSKYRVILNGLPAVIGFEASKRGDSFYGTTYTGENKKGGSLG